MGLVVINDLTGVLFLFLIDFVLFLCILYHFKLTHVYLTWFCPLLILLGSYFLFLLFEMREHLFVFRSLYIATRWVWGYSPASGTSTTVVVLKNIALISFITVLIENIEWGHIIQISVMNNPLANWYWA